MLILRILVAAAVFALSVWLFKKAAGNLKFSKMNMISLIFYYIMVFSLTGGSLIYLGLRDHYLVSKVRLPVMYDYAYYALAYCCIMLPAMLLFTKKLCARFIPRKNINAYVGEGIRYNNRMIRIQGTVLVLMMICTAATVYVFVNLGYIPIVDMFRKSDLNALRISGSRFFQGNDYIKNLLMGTLTPYVSYFCYIYFRITKSKTWRIFFIYMALLSVIVLTYDFSKSPIISYLIGIYLIEVLLGNTKNNKRFNRLLLSVIAIILFFYVVVFDIGDSLFSIYTGPIGRVLFTQIATLFLHFDAFPAQHGFLYGASFNRWMSFFIPNAEGLRSGQVVMSLYNAEGVETNTAGVMNTLFVGEAYANFYIAGVILAPIIFGLIIGFISHLLPSLKKTPITILFYVQMTLQFVTVVEGGFVDIFYNASFLFIIIVTVILHFASGKANRMYYKPLNRKPMTLRLKKAARQK